MSSSSPSELSGETVRERDAAGVASTPDDAPVANGGGSCTGDFLAIDGEGIIGKSRVFRPSQR